MTLDAPTPGVLGEHTDGAFGRERVVPERPEGPPRYPPPSNSPAVPDSVLTLVEPFTCFVPPQAIADGPMSLHLLP